MKKYRAFTLAEVLLTLMIIGVIAGMTIPALRKNTMNRTVATNLKKAYSELNQATSLAMTTNEVDKLYRSGIFDSQNNFDKEFVYKYFSVMRECPSGSSNDCAGGNNFQNNKTYLLSNGIALNFDYCLSGGWAENPFTCNVFVDVNGPKAPNKGGSDQFMMGINTHDGRVYLGSYSSRNNERADFDDSCKNGDDYQMAWACGAKIMLDGWQIKY